MSPSRKAKAPDHDAAGNGPPCRPSPTGTTRMPGRDANPLLALLSKDDSEARIPTADMLQSRLRARIAEVGSPALAEFAYVQQRAAELWGAGPTAHFGRVLRKARTSTKAATPSKFDKARAAVERLPVAWQGAFHDKIALSETGKARAGEEPWSADYLLAVIRALVAWVGFCEARALPLRPTGVQLERYARACAERRDDPVSVRTASDYLLRIHAGYALIEPGYPSGGCEHVMRDWCERASLCGTPTKTGAQLVTARAIYDLGFSRIAAARARPMRGLHAARDFRNGLLLAVGSALPERARALSWLAFDRSLFLLDDGHIHIRLPASGLKMLQRLKPSSDGRDTLFQNARLHAALGEYRALYRPLFDEGACLFPSMKAPGMSISEAQIGRLVGNMTLAAFGTRVPVHRIRDNVATDAAEHLEGGILAASSLLGHRNIETTRTYDHSQGTRAAQAFGEYLESARLGGVDLDL